MIFTFLLVYVPHCKSLGVILAQSGSLNRYLYMLTGIILTSATCINFGLQELGFVLVHLDSEF